MERTVVRYMSQGVQSHVMDERDAGPTLDDVYRKFGDVSEAAQLLETELGSTLLWVEAVDAGLLETPDKELATAIYGKINRQTLGQLVKSLNRKDETIEALETLLVRAIKERNRLFHSFYRKHNFRRNSGEGRAVMMNDLETIHATLLDAYKAVMLLSGVDLEAEIATGHVVLPVDHVRI